MIIHDKFPIDFVDKCKEAIKGHSPENQARMLAAWYSSAALQRDAEIYGKKMAKHMKTVPMPTSLLNAAFRSHKVRAAFRKKTESFGIATIDQSYVTAAFAAELGIDPRCQMWHFNIDSGRKLVDVAYESDYSALAVYIDAIADAEGKHVDDDHIFTGAWAVAGYLRGTVDAATLAEVGRIALAVIKGGKGVGFRDFDAVSLGSKSARAKCFVFVHDASSTIAEFWDIPAAVLITSSIGAALAGFKAEDGQGFDRFRFADGSLKAWADNLRSGVDPYKTIFDAILARYPKTNIFGKLAKWTKSTRNRIKLAVSIMLNCDLDFVRVQHQISSYFWIEGRRHIRTTRGNVLKQRSARLNCLVWEAIRQAFPAAWLPAMAAKLHGQKDGFYTVHTAGEKAAIKTIQAWYKAHHGITLHRVHDALWTADPRAKAMTDKQVKNEIADLFMSIANQGPAYGRAGIRRLAKYAGITDADLDVVRDALRLTGETAKEFARICSDPNDYGYSVSVEDRTAKIA